MMTCVLAGGYSQASLAQQAKSGKLTQFVNLESEQVDMDTFSSEPTFRSDMSS